MDRVAIVSDIHGNMTAWSAVLADIAEVGAAQTFCLGDLAGKGPRGAAVVDSCQVACTGVVRGNWDEYLSHPSHGDSEAINWHRGWLLGNPSPILSYLIVTLCIVQRSCLHTRSSGSRSPSNRRG